jgi:DNA-binding response OmpR family regulator
MQRYVIIAEGASSLTERIKSYFIARGYRATTVANALEGIELIKSELPDVLVLDCALLWGGCDGVLDWLQADPVGCRIPVVLMTEQSCPESHHPLVVRQMRRPFDVESLLQAVNMAILPTECESSSRLSPAKRDVFQPIMNGL